MAVTASSASASRFGVLDVVQSLIPGEDTGLGVVVQVRRYVTGGLGYAVASLDPNDEIVGGIYGEGQLAATSRDPVKADHFWTGELRPREVVQVTDTHPKMQLRGSYGVIHDEPRTGRYGVAFVGRSRTRYRDIAARHLRPTGERLPPDPVPRPVITYGRGSGDGNWRPTHDFDILDDLDQYL